MTQPSRIPTQITDPSGRTVAANVRRVREARGLSTYELARKLKAERPISPSALAKIERAERRVDVGDLMALAVALGVSPTALLLPVKVEPDEQIEVTGSTPVTAYSAWHWIEGGGPLKLPTERGVSGGLAMYQALMEYRLYGRPHWLVEMEDEQHDAHSRLITEQYEREQRGKEPGGTDG
ncbi:helix-turn-helix domain-containing protein [Streptomyces niveus]|uniref:helix-turn-helix domain-containing protein n=1 Tax=Streptomyces niveus TaxID=193462 RepID=UPI00369B0638